MEKALNIIMEDEKLKSELMESKSFEEIYDIFKKVDDSIDEKQFEDFFVNFFNEIEKNLDLNSEMFIEEKKQLNAVDLSKVSGGKISRRVVSATLASLMAVPMVGAQTKDGESGQGMGVSVTDAEVKKDVKRKETSERLSERLINKLKKMPLWAQISSGIGVAGIPIVAITAALRAKKKEEKKEEKKKEITTGDADALECAMCPDQSLGAEIPDGEKGYLSLVTGCGIDFRQYGTQTWLSRFNEYFKPNGKIDLKHAKNAKARYLLEKAVIADQLRAVGGDKIGKEAEEADGCVVGDDLDGLHDAARDVRQNLRSLGFGATVHLNTEAKKDGRNDERQNGSAAPELHKVRLCKEIDNHVSKSESFSDLALCRLILSLHQRDAAHDDVHDDCSNGRRHEERDDGHAHDLACPLGAFHVGNGGGDGAENHRHDHAEHEVDEYSAQRLQRRSARPYPADNTAADNTDEHANDKPVIFPEAFLFHIDSSSEHGKKRRFPEIDFFSAHSDCPCKPVEADAHIDPRFPYAPVGATPCGRPPIFHTSNLKCTRRGRCPHRPVSDIPYAELKTVSLQTSAALTGLQSASPRNIYIARYLRRPYFFSYKKTSAVHSSSSRISPSATMAVGPVR